MQSNNKSYRININYGHEDINEIIGDLAQQTVARNVSEFNNSNLRVKKTLSLGRVS
ncbi:hypothetical protein [Sutcliffiella cohnii]|uniref:hypothetical protein n=1 Tax=Sutcliffiella cohnii TaxID=33932 RepID=UPI002E1D1004|nr:hypothetical protein [Sutcliffiella cohnii]